MTPRGTTAAIALALATALAVPLAIGPAAAAPTAPASSTPTTGADPAAAALPGGPRPTSIRLSEDDASTTVLVHGLGDAQTERSRENRRMRHSDLQPTARYVTEGETLTITVPQDAPRMSVVIGLYGAHSFSNGGAAVGRVATDLTPGTNTVEASLDGMVFLRSTVSGGSADVIVEGGRPVPHFVLGQTSNERFRAEMARLVDAPIITVIGHRIFGDFQRGRTGTQIAAADVPTRVAMWDRSVEITNATYGLLDDGTGTARKAPHRIYVAAPDAIPGAYATASDESINFPAGGAARDLFVRDQTQLWGFWHEIGHTYQAPTYLWSGMSEVTVNISPLHVESAQGWNSTVDSTGHLNTLNRFFAKPVEERDYATSGTNEIFFDHLRRGFGDEFFPRLNQEMRVLAARGEADALTDEAKRQLFAVTAARVADRDLREHFRQWGFALSTESAAVMAELPALEKPIWDNRHSRDMIREREMSPYSVPLGEAVAVTESVAVGQRQLSTTPTVSGLRDSDGDRDARVTDTGLRAGSVGTGAALVTATNDIGVREVFSTPVTVTPGTSFQFRGLSDRIVASLALQPAAGELRLFAGTTYNAHPNFGASEYIGATVHDARGREKAAFSVKGNETAHAAARVFDGTAIRDGMYLTVRHREANSRSTRWDDGTQVARNPATTQHYRVDGGRLVGVASIPAPPDGPLVGLPVTDPVVLSRSAPTEVPVTVEATDAIDAVTGELVLTAPEGTRFADPQEALVTQVRQPGGDWVALDALVADGAVRSDDGGSLTLALRSTADLGLADGTQLRWAPEITVPASAAGGDLELRWALTGTADRSEVTATS